LLVAASHHCYRCRLPFAVRFLSTQDKVRCIKYDQQQQAAVTACLDGVIAWWTPELQLVGACKVPGKFSGPQSLLLQGNLAVVGTQRAAVLIDSRVAHTPVASVTVGGAPQRKRRRIDVETPAAAGETVASADAGVQAADACWQQTQQWNQQQEQQQQLRQWQRQETDDEEASGSFDSDDRTSSNTDDEAALEVAEQAEGHGEQGSSQQQQQQGIDPGSQQRQLAGQLLASLRSNDIAEQQRLQHQLPGRVVYAMQRFVEQEMRSQQARTGSDDMATADLQSYMQRGSSVRLRYAEGPQDRLAAHISGSVCVESHHGLVANGVSAFLHVTGKRMAYAY
jgi:hypothetical protein